MYFFNYISHIELINSINFLLECVLAYLAKTYEKMKTLLLIIPLFITGIVVPAAYVGKDTGIDSAYVFCWIGGIIVGVILSGLVFSLIKYSKSKI